MNWLPKRKNSRLQLLVGLALASELLYLFIASIQEVRTKIPQFLAGYLAVFIIYWFACSFFFITEENTSQSPAPPTRGPFSWINDFFVRQKLLERLKLPELLTVGILFGILFRITLLFTTPGLSDDIYRYIWDGRVATAGINPYNHPPGSDELAELRDEIIYPRINHKDIPTVYPPFLQLVFRAFYQIDPGILLFKAGFLAFDLLIIWVLYLILKRLKLDQRRLLIYVWNPLLIVEIAGNSHADIVGILLLVLSCYLILRDRLVSANFALALSFLTKFIAGLLLPVIILLKKGNRMVMAILFVIFTGIFYLPFAGAGGRLFAGLSVYTMKWENNSSVFGWLRSTLKSTVPEAWVINYYIPKGMVATPETVETMGTDAALLVAKVIVALVFGAYVLYYLWRFEDDVKRENGVWVFKLGLKFLGLFLLLSPTVHPWYVCWLLPFLAVHPVRPWLLWSGLVTLSYWNLTQYTQTGVWQESILVKYLEYLPVFFWLAYDFVSEELREGRLFKRSLNRPV